MRLLITPALLLTEEQKRILETRHDLFFLKDERIPLQQQELQFDLGDIEGIVCNFFFQHNDFSILPNLRFVQLTSAGLDRVPVEKLKCAGIALYNAGATYSVPMAEWCVGKIIELYKCAPFFYRNQQNHSWEKNRSLRELSGQTAVILGFGNVGKQIAKRLRGFDMKIRAVDLFRDESGLSDEGFVISEMQEALKDADIVILTLPLTEKTYHIIDRRELKWMKTSAILINVARGALINMDSLVNSLQRKEIAGAALDAFENEPLNSHSCLWEMEQVLISPHNSFVGNGNQQRLFQVLLDNLEKQEDPKNDHRMM